MHVAWSEWSEKSVSAKGPAGGANTSHYQDAGRLPAASEELPRVPNPTLDSELDCRWRGKDGEGSCKLLIYINTNIR